jgi:hypothetical protein
MNIGDRIKLRPNAEVGNLHKKDVTGTIVGFGKVFNYLVQFDEFIDGHEGMAGNIPPDGFGWFVFEREIELLTNKVEVLS